jgi:hypothetical protein
MKNILLLITIATLIASVYFTWNRQKWTWRHHSTIITNDGNNYEEIKYAGDISFTDDEKAFKEISPGGFLTYRRNNIKLDVESDQEGHITYEIYDGNKILQYDNAGAKIVTDAIKEMIAQGFDAKNRMERIYKNGGSTALLAEAVNMQNEYCKSLYLTYLLNIDSLSHDDMTKLIKAAGSMSSGYEKVKILNSINPGLLKYPEVMDAWLAVVDKLDADYEKQQALSHSIGRGIVSQENFGAFLDIIDLMDADYEKKKAIELLVDRDKLSAAQWIQILNLTRHISADYDKSALLVGFASRMLPDEQVKNTYRTVARTISSENDYGKAMKALE